MFISYPFDFCAWAKNGAKEIRNKNNELRNMSVLFLKIQTIKRNKINLGIKIIMVLKQGDIKRPF